VARREATVSSKVTGKVMVVLVEEGMQVEEGQILARLDSSNVKTSLDLAQAQLAAAESSWPKPGCACMRRSWSCAAFQARHEPRGQRRRTRPRHGGGEFPPRALAQQTAEVGVAERQVALGSSKWTTRSSALHSVALSFPKRAARGDDFAHLAGGGFTRTGICTIVDMVRSNRD